MEKPTEYTLTWEVTDEMTAKRIGSAGSKILSTPNMVALMEAAALELAKAYLDEGMTTVGAEIHCRHLAPTPVGMKVSATARLRSIERRKMWFDIEVNDEKGKCGEGSHLHGRPQGDPGEGGAEEGLIPGLWGAPSKTDGVSRPFLMAGRQRPDRLSPGENLEVLKILALAS